MGKLAYQFAFPGMLLNHAARASVTRAWISALLSLQLFVTELFLANRSVSAGLADVPDLTQPLRALPCAVKLSSSSSLQ